MANELKLAAAAREIARKLVDLPSDSLHPFGEGFVFKGDDKAPCCVIGHVIHAAGMSELVHTNAERLMDGRVAYRSSNEAITDVVGAELPDSVSQAVGAVVWANDHETRARAVEEPLYGLANALEETAAPEKET